MFEYFNPHPKGLLVGDCVKRAIVAVTSEPYQEVARSLNAFKKQTGVEKFNDYPNPQEYVQECLGAHELICDPISVADFCKKHPRGKYILETPNTEAKDYFYPFSKIYDTTTTLVENTKRKIKRGIFLDIFPLDGIGNSLEESKSNYAPIYKKYNLLLTRVAGIRKGRSFYKNLAVLLFRLVPDFILNSKKILKDLSNTCQQYDFGLLAS